MWLTADEAVAMGLATDRLVDRPASTLSARAFKGLRFKDLAPAASLIVEAPKVDPAALPGVPPVAAMASPAVASAPHPEPTPAALPAFLDGLDLEVVQAAIREAPELRAKVEAQVVKIAALEAAIEAQERESILAKLRAEGKLTPAQETKLIPKLSMEALRDFEATAPVVVPTSKVREPAKPSTARLLDKPFGELDGAELHEVHEADPEAYAAAKKAAGR